MVALAVLGLWRSRRLGAGTWVLAGVAASFAVGYAVFWSPYSIVALWPGVQTMGPFYHLALLIPLTLFGAAGLAALFERTRVGTITLVAIMLVATGLGFNSQVQRNLQVTDQYRATMLVQLSSRRKQKIRSTSSWRTTLRRPTVLALVHGTITFRLLALMVSM